MNVEEMAWADVAKTKLDLIYPHSAPLDANMTKSEAVARIDEFDVVAIDVDLDGDNDRDVDGDPIDTSDMGRGGDVTMQGIENGIGNDGRTYIEAQSSVVTLVLRAKASGGQFSHYRVLDRSDHKANNSGIEWAYQMLASRVHP